MDDASAATDGIRWEVDGSRGEAIRRWIASVHGDVPPGKPVGSNRYRTTYRIPPDPEGIFPDGLFLKRFHPPSGLRRWKRRIEGPPAAWEWRLLRKLRKIGLPVPEPLALGLAEREGLDDRLLTAAIPDATSLHDFGYGTYQDLSRPDRRVLWTAVAALVRRLHDAGIEHRDLHGGNLLVRRTEDGFDLHPIDVYAVYDHGKPILYGFRPANLAILVSSIGFASPSEQALLVRLALPASGRAEARRALEEIRDRVSVIHHRHWRSRTKRCMRNTSGFRVDRLDPWTVYRVRELSTDHVREIVKRHESALLDGPAEGVRIAKNARESAVTTGIRIDVWPAPLAVKEYRPRGRLDRLMERLRRPRGKRAWIAANGLFARGIPTPRPLALAFRTHPGPRRAWIVTEIAPGTELDRTLVTRALPDFDTARRRRLRDRVARTLRLAHERGVRLSDVKTCNLVVEESGNDWTLRFVDVDGTRFERDISRNARLRNLVQLNTTTPRGIGDADRRAFLRTYAAPLPRALRRWLLRATANISAGRSILYVGRDGDVTETWR